ncbi:serine/threonine-protein kinase [Actinoplanes regularis]|uniref:non-specific serine/threonine protein kinase n=1 Tax=Actinoplanes regularis TaxID=52697 RepID=A0A239I3R9_9ACTN|nr:serine/threonine-protein kinase [Actinoplanes regularis]GIE91375.1 hypothetical protein Are01nite_78550 [Actinoplanes regularis]SNS88159.1 serine/threonine protein kinase [Actinoplanes regularis]
MLAPGIVLNGRYQLTQRIAAGGMGEVWRGGDLLLQRDIAVKVLLPALMNDREFITRFRSEARMMAQLRHGGIVQVYDYGENTVVDGERFDYLVMEYVEGVSLNNKIQQAGRLSPAETMSITAGVADALHAAHQAGIIHRDVKPGNLLVRPGGAIVLVDFGVARSVGINGMTGTNVVMGSAHYMAPEQAEGQPVTAATDVYALGAVAFACLTGRPPYVGDNPLAVLAQLVHGQPPVLPPDVPRGVASVVLRALAKNPAQRFPSGAAFADAARNALRAPTAPPPQAPGGPWGTPTMRQPAGPPQTMRQPSVPAAYAAAPPPPPPPMAPARLPEPAPEPGNRRTMAIVASAAGLIALGVGVLIAVNSADKPDETAGRDTSGFQLQTDNPAPPPATHKGGKQGDQKPAQTKTKDPKPEETGEAAPNEEATPEETEETNKYDPSELCGADYQVIDQTDLKSPAGVTKGRIYLLHRGSDGSNCVVTLRTAGLSKKATGSAFLEVQGQERQIDGGTFQYFTGPVEAKAPATCVKWGGSIGALAYESDFEHCE